MRIDLIECLRVFLSAFSIHSKHKAQNRYRKQKFLLGHLKSAIPSSNISSPLIEEPPSNEMLVNHQTTTTTETLPDNDLPQTTFNLLPEVIEKHEDFVFIFR